MSNLKLAENLSVRRMNDRYFVLGLNGMKGRIRGILEEQTFVCLGEGGCGIFSPEKIKISDLGPMLCEIKWDPYFPKGVRMHTQIIFCTPKQIEGKTLYYYGLRFHEPHQIKPFIRRLKKLADRGLVSIFLR